MDKSEIQREHFNKISKLYLSSRENKNHLAYKQIWWDSLLNYLQKNLIIKDKKMECLEAMCGIAEGSQFFIKRFPHFHFEGFDYSDEMVEHSKQVNGENVRIFQQDMLKFKSEKKYDLVIILGGLHHVPDGVSIALQNIYNSLKPGGLFINLEPTHNNWLFKKIRERIYKKNSLFEENSERGFELDQYNTLLTGNKFKILKQFYPGLVGYVLYYNPDAFPFLNIGNTFFSKFFSKLDWMLGKTWIGKKFSFATWTIAEKV